MYQIGAFSRVVGLSVKTLRYYHDIGLLEPAEIDTDSGYRYYSETEFFRAQRIIFLKELNFTLPEISEVLTHLDDDSDLQAYLKEKQDQLDMQIRELKKVQNAIQMHLDKEVKFMDEKIYTFELITVPEQLIASIRYKGKYDEAGKYISILFKAVGGNARGPVFALYHDASYMEEGADIEMCVPVKKAIEKGEVTSRILESETYLTTMHIGPYDKLNYAYKAMQDEMDAKGLESSIPIRETYEKGPGMLLKGNPEKYKTVLQFPVKNKK